ncbi:MAG: hypothetical protein EXX96DRAFT_524744 [Benjaminiella poitrasii]|nr:MAG: hypothetical protein EXX96DRAFT_524744 [Benjaminiella poitrasii]
MATTITAATVGATIKKTIAEDDFESQQKRNVRQPEVCVDYLSYKFDEMDLAASWRVMTKQKNDVVDGIRLENASWRTWAKQRNNLKTISPQTLNWLKDSDVTWLYGPLHTVIRTEEDPFLTPKQSTTEETLGLMLPDKNKKKPVLKSALKKVTAVDLLKRSATELLLNTSQQHQRQHHLSVSHRKISISDVNNQLKAVSPVVLATHRQPRLRFNHRVEQCIALALDDDERGHDDLYEEDLLDSDDDRSGSARKSIKKIAPARLKKSQSDGDTDDVSSISSTSTASSAGPITLSPAVTSPVVCHQDLTYTEKSIAEPALVTMHQTARDINKINGEKNNSRNANFTLFNQIANWAAAYLLPASHNKSPNPAPSLSTPLIPTVNSQPISIEKSYVPPASSNSSSI